MPKKASTHGASAPSKSKTARSKTAKAKSKDKAAPRKEARKTASEAARKRTAAAAGQGESPRRKPAIAKGFRFLFDYSDEVEEEGAVTEPQEISNDLDEQQERYQAAQLQGAPAPPTPVYHRGYYPPDAGSGSPMLLEHLKAPRGLNHGRTSRGAYERALVQDEPLFVNDIEAASLSSKNDDNCLFKDSGSISETWEEKAFRASSPLTMEASVPPRKHLEGS
ncbi:ABC Superfamily [Phytophthora palmivora]|uniref:ABC Superfamily n=1 Tax=Phytophthora palmivora TaxID=4796 RepID=A0A2P4XCV8_9STRA|nr:ABC Superfamily [Phytophthora palmivora]